MMTLVTKENDEGEAAVLLDKRVGHFQVAVGFPGKRMRNPVQVVAIPFACVLKNS